MFPFNRWTRKSVYDPATEAILATSGALDTFHGVIAQLTVANDFFSDAIDDAHLTAEYHDEEVEHHMQAAAERRAAAQSHAEAIAKNETVVGRLRALVG